MSTEPRRSNEFAGAMEFVEGKTLENLIKRAGRLEVRLVLEIAMQIAAGLAVGVDESQIEASFCAAIRTAKEQKSTSLATRAEATYAEYRSQKGEALLGHGFRLPLC